MAAKKKASVLSAGLDFVSVAARTDKDYGEYCVIRNGDVVAYDGVVAAGIRLAMDTHFTIAPHVGELKLALKHAGEPYSLTIPAELSLVVSGQSYRAAVRCIELGRVPGAGPDPAMTEPPTDLVFALGMAASILPSTPKLAVEALVEIRGPHVYATNGIEIICVDLDREFHSMLVPRELVAAVKKCKEIPSAIGWSNSKNTMTVWFDQHRWIRTQLYDEDVVKFGTFYDTLHSALAGIDYGQVYAPATELAYSLALVKTFVVNDTIWLTPSGVATALDGKGASHECAHNLQRGRYPYEALNRAALHATMMAYGSNAVAWRNNKMMCAFSGFTPWEQAIAV